MRNKRWIIGTVVLSVMLVLSITIGNLVVAYMTGGQTTVVFIDDTTEKPNTEQDEEGDGDSGQLPVEIQEVEISHSYELMEDDIAGNYTAYFDEDVVLYEDDELKKIYDNVVSLVTKTDGIYMELDSMETALKGLEVGDVCVLEDIGNSPFGETYFVKVTDIQKANGNTIYVLDNPTFDEVFDVFSMNLDRELDNSDIVNMVLMDGVSVARDETSTFELRRGGIPGEVTVNTEDGIVLEFEIDLKKLLQEGNAGGGSNGTDEDDEIGEDRYRSRQEAGSIRVYRIDLFTKDGVREQEGDIYHNEGCILLKEHTRVNGATEKKVESTLLAEDKTTHGACNLCKAPLINPEESDSIGIEEEGKVLFSGKLGIESLHVDGNIDYNCYSKPFIKEMYVDVSGKVVAETKLSASEELSLSGATTNQTLPNGWGKIEGLDEKLIPLGYVQWIVGTTAFNAAAPGAASNESIRAMTGLVPASVIVELYIDVNGNFKAEASLCFSYSKEFNYHAQLMKNDRFDWEFGDTAKDPGELAVTIGAEVNADVDANMGASACLYFYNINVAEVVLVQIGTEGQGHAKLEYAFKYGDVLGTGTEAPIEEAAKSALEKFLDNVNFEFDYDGRLYMKLLQLKVRISVNLNVYDVFGVDFDFNQETEPLKDVTFIEWGDGYKKKEEPVIEYDANKHITKAGVATDGTNVYYIDLQQNLIGQDSDNCKTILFHNIDYICGIDEEYVYIVAENPLTEQRCLYRVNKQTGLHKVIGKDVKTVFFMDTQYVYYNTNFDATNVKRVGKSSGDIIEFINMDKNVAYLDKYGDGFYLTVQSVEPFGTFYYPYYVSGDGKNIEQKDLEVDTNYGLYILFDSYVMKEVPLYKGLLSKACAQNLVQYGNTAEFVPLENATFTNTLSYGMFVAEDIDSDPFSDTGYRIVYIDGMTGAKTVVLEDVPQARVAATFCQDTAGNWYYLRMVDGKVSLCCRNAGFGNEVVLASVGGDKMLVDLNACSVTVVNGVAYFYQEKNGRIEAVYRVDMMGR